MNFHTNTVIDTYSIGQVTREKGQKTKQKIKRRKSTTSTENVNARLRNLEIFLANVQQLAVPWNNNVRLKQTSVRMSGRRENEPNLTLTAKK